MSDIDVKSLGKVTRDHGVSIDAKEADTGAVLVAGETVVLDRAENARIRRKIDRHLLPLMCTLYIIQFMDKNTLSSSAILGIRTSAHLTPNQYNWLGTIFYLSYLLFEYPQNLALQRFPVGKWMSLNILVWAIALICHIACTSFRDLFVVRMILGICEGSITAGFMIVSSMFYTRNEQTVRVGIWFSMNGIGTIIASFIAFGSLHIHTKNFQPWQWLMLITGILTLFTAVAFYYFFPDSPTNAWFLTPEEKIKAVHRIQENQTGIENKSFKKEQMIEAVKDIKTWLFALYCVVANLPNGLIYQRQIIVSSFGFSNLQTTLLGCVDGVIQIIAIYTGVWAASHIPNSRAWVSIIYYIPNILGALLVTLLPWSRKVGLLWAMWLTDINSASFVIFLGWVSQATAGHTKKVTTNAIILSAYCIGQAVAPFLWQAKYKPRYYVPWIICGVSYICCLVILYSMRVFLIARNKRRDAEPHDDTYEDVYVLKMDKDGKYTEVRVDKEFLDLTDKQNRDFRYVY
ncbi:MFS general substrate transporter [Artomyces pyxidatus]|uniref:MFS general substrate transporter n=1 Tax=Artomyces pyxidatus TaxID=48021 RepID=A0ACB8TDA8_9AGAM|nr:MFS general substrate transporter [Artomyces pyxidatus]